MFQSLKEEIPMNHSIKASAVALAVAMLFAVQPASAATKSGASKSKATSSSKKNVSGAQKSKATSSAAKSKANSKPKK